jgi:DNA polymerase-3 subunit gamma/tau
MVLLRFLAFPAEGAVERAAAAPRAAPLRAPAPPVARTVVRPAMPKAVPVFELPGAAPEPLRAAEPESALFVAKAGAEVARAVPTIAPVAQSTAVEAVEAIEATADPALGDRWTALVAGLIEAGSVQALARELAWSAALLVIDERSTPPTWRLAVEREPLRNPVLRDKLAAALAEALGTPLQLELVPGRADDSPARRDAAARARRQAEAEQAIQADPVVRELLATYPGARIVPGSIKPV